MYKYFGLTVCLNRKKRCSSEAGRILVFSIYFMLFTLADVLLVIQEVNASSKSGVHHSQVIQIFLDAADVSMSKLEYTTPLEHNAFQLYRSVLLLDAENVKARKGVDLIRVAYVKLLDKAVAEDDLARIRSYYHRAKGVGVAGDVLKLYEKKFEPITDRGSKRSSGITLNASASIEDVIRLRRIGKSYQSQKDFKRAAKVYEKLIKINSVNSGDWLGFAVSLDSIGSFDEAVSAYQKVVYLKHSNPKIVAFARHRVEELSAMSDN